MAHPLWRIYNVPHPHWECDDLLSLEAQKRTSLPFCYVIKIDGMDYCKIGSTGNIRSRMNAYRTGLPFKIGIIFAVSAPNDGSHILVEKKAHQLLIDQKVRGEWFACGEGDAINAVRQASVWAKEFMK